MSPSPRYQHSMNLIEDLSYLVICGGRNDDSADIS